MSRPGIFIYLPVIPFAGLFAFALVSCGEKEPASLPQLPPTNQDARETAITFEAPPLGEFIDEAELPAHLLAKLDRPEIRQFIEATEATMRETLVPRLELKEVTFFEALSAIQSCSVEYSPEPNPERRGISIIVDRKGDWRPDSVRLADPSSENDSAVPAAADPFATTEAPAPQPEPEKPEPPISEVYVNRSIRELLDEVAGRYSCWVQVEPYSVHIYPNSTPKPVYATVAFAVPPDFLSGFEPAAVDPFAGDIPAVGERKETTARDVLENAGIVFGGLSNAVYDEPNSRLIVRAPMEHLELISAYLQRNAK